LDGSTFDRIAKTLSDSAARRGTLKALAGGSLAALAGRLGRDPVEAKRRRKRCRKIGQSCGTKKCCNKSGLVRCQDFPSNQECGGFGQEITGRRCCGLVGAHCDPNFGTPDLFGNCSCCAHLFCGQVGDEFRCTEEDV
jgi:hypothetical protein